MEPELTSAALQERLGYTFRDTSHLIQAMTHRSFANEHPELDRQDNETLEFLGDAVLDLVVGHCLMEQLPDLREGQLSVMRAQVVSEAGLAEVGRELELGRGLWLGRGEKRSGGCDKSSLIADAVEAMVAAVYLDGGFDAAWQVVNRLFAAPLEQAKAGSLFDPKTSLQERSQAEFRLAPSYVVVGESGPDHEKIFEVSVSIGEREWARAKGRSKKEAEQRAARRAMELLDSASEAAGKESDE